MAAAAVPLWGALPDLLILDWDATVQTKYGHQEGAVVGYNPHRPGRRSLHPLLAVAAGTRLCVAYRFRSGDTVSATQWESAMADARRALGTRQVWLVNRGDMGFGHERILAWHGASVAPRPHYLFKLRLTANVRRALAALPESAWQGPAQRGVLQVAEFTLQLPGWSRARRVVAGRRLLGVIPAQQAGAFWLRKQHEFETYVTDLGRREARGWQIVELYRNRADTENVFDELKHQRGFDGFCCRKRNATALAARLGLLVYNLWYLLLAPARTGPSCGKQRRTVMAPAHRRTAHPKRAPKVVLHWCGRRVVGATQGRLPEDLPLAGPNCAAVEILPRPRPDSAFLESTTG